MGQINHPATLVDQVNALRKELAELRKRIGDRQPITFTAVRPQDMPAVTGDTFEVVWAAEVSRTYPRFELATLDGCDESAAGEGRIVIGGTVVASWTVAPGVDRRRWGPFTLPVDSAQVGVEYRRSSGTGSVRAAVVEAWPV